MVVMLIYTIYSIRKRTGTHWQRFGPTYFVSLAVPLVMADLTRHLLLDHLHISELKEYRSGCPDENVRCLTVLGWFFTIIFTYLGFLCLFIGSLWNANICEKIQEIKKKWRELREQHAGAKLVTADGVAASDDDDAAGETDSQILANLVAPAPIVAVTSATADATPPPVEHA